MSPIQALFLLCWAVLDLLLLVFSPSRAYAIAVQGLPKRVVQDQWKEKAWAEGCNLAAGGLLELVVTMIVEPAYMLWALAAHVGSSEIALAALGLFVANSVTSSIRLAQGSKQETHPKITWVRWLEIHVFALTTLYPWYLFVVVIGVVR